MQHCWVTACKENVSVFPEFKVNMTTGQKYSVRKSEKSLRNVSDSSPVRLKEKPYQFAVRDAYLVLYFD